MADPNDPKHRFHELVVADVIQETADARSFVFDVPAALRALFAYVPGQFLTFEIPWNGFRVHRCYSLSSAPECDPAPKVTVKRVDQGRVSNWMNERLAKGDRIAVKPPEGLFVLRPEEQERPIVMFGGGSGITPLLSIAKHALDALATEVRRSSRDRRRATAAALSSGDRTTSQEQTA